MLTTDANRLAEQGGLDFVDDEYESIAVALLDANGRAKARQKISGQITKQVADKMQYPATPGTTSETA